MNIINSIMKLWYKLPKYKIRNPFLRHHIDDRSYDWYLDRKKFGFDERVLWNLSNYLDDKIRIFLKLPASENDYVTVEQFSVWIKDPKAIEDIRWFYERLSKYTEWECPYFYWDKDKETNLSEEKVKEVLEKYHSLLGCRVSGMIPSDKDIEFLHKYNRFGW